MTAYKVTWTTEIIDAVERWTEDGHTETVTERHPVDGYLILRAESLEDARATAEESLVDVSFFTPGDNHPSAANPDVLEGEMWIHDRPETKARRMYELLPEVETWDFDTIDIVDVVPR